MVNVSIIIVNWNSGNFLKGCIESLQTQSYRDFEIVLVDNASTDGSTEFVEKNFPEVRIIRSEKNLGFAGGNNLGILNSKSELVCLFNPDAIAEKNWLSTLVSVLQSSEKIGGAAGKLYYLDDRFGKNAIFCTWSKIGPLSGNPSNFYNNEPVSKVDYFTGAAMLVKRKMIQKIGLLDTEYFLYFEETDLCARMIRAGYDLIYVPTAIAWHAVSPLSNSEKKLFYMDRNRIRFAIKNFDQNYMPIFWLILVGESFAIFLKDLKKHSFFRTKTRLKSISWNIRNMASIMKKRKEDFLLIKNNSSLHSYNKKLPLRKIKHAK